MHWNIYIYIYIYYSTLDLSFDFNCVLLVSLQTVDLVRHMDVLEGPPIEPPLYEAGQKPAIGLKRLADNVKPGQVNGCHVLLQQLQAICTARRVSSPVHQGLEKPDPCQSALFII